ncbi:receptor EIX2 [Olea europaea subsp. europaea]|uniref:Receptor EIX2 n=1 Tax=Olea europaea subsp. europaea TaxID=158383 RepID=A0A8S0QVK1_OLEEU|nr:receptor EIX2 [Olea europaea subsp. europaea]
MIADKKIFRQFVMLIIVPSLLSLRAGFGNSSRVNDVKIRCLEKEREALLKFKDELIDEHGLLSSWGTAIDRRDCCEWSGVQCHNQTNHVIVLDLHGRLNNSGLFSRLRGNVSQWLLELRYLNYLDLSANDFNLGRIPEFIGSLGKLQHLDLSASNFGGPIPHHLGNLTQLQFLSLKGYNNHMLTSTNLDWLSKLHLLNYLELTHVNLKEATDWIQAIMKLPRLQDLRLSSCHLQPVLSPYPMTNASNSLSVLDLSDNELSSSSVFPWLLNFSSTLSYVKLDFNNLQGPIPHAIGNIISLETLSLFHNELEGSIPLSFGNLSSLKFLDLSFNNLSGTVTERIGTLAKLKYLGLEANQLEGIIIEAHFSSLSQLQYLSLNYNPCISFNFSSGWIPLFQLTSLWLGGCKVGPHFPKWLKSQNELIELDISNTSIKDTFPDWFWDLCPKLVVLDVSRNNIHGVLPDLSSKFFTFNFIDLSSNHFNGSLPSLPPNGLVLKLSNNKFFGSITVLCNKTDWVYLDLSNNLLSGDLPDCFANLENLEFLNLAHNNFSGKIPSLNSIASLHLQNNSFTGECPASLKNIPFLEFIDLSKNKLTGKIPEWLGDSLPELVFLSLQSNQFSGNIPSNLCHLSHIQVLDISLNKISGAIPKCLNNLTAMIQEVESDSYIVDLPFMLEHERANVRWKGEDAEYKTTLKLVKLIDLSSNNLEGEIPSEITSLVNLVGLNLSRNNLIGFLPPKIDQLKSLNFLDLSRNQLSGEIPASFSHLDRLGVLDMSHNNLSGKIPWTAHLTTFNATSYAGNSGLCGPPLTKVCPGDEIAQDPKFIGNNSGMKNIDEEDKLITEGYYFSLLIGFMFGLLGVIGTLLLNQSLRLTYFKFWNIE